MISSHSFQSLRNGDQRAKAELVDPERMAGLDPAMNDPQLLDALALKGIKIDPKTGKKLIPEVLNRKTVVKMKMQGRNISEE